MAHSTQQIIDRPHNDIEFLVGKRFIGNAKNDIEIHRRQPNFVVCTIVRFRQLDRWSVNTYFTRTSSGCHNQLQNILRTDDLLFTKCKWRILQWLTLWQVIYDIIDRAIMNMTWSVHCHWNAVCLASGRSHSHRHFRSPLNDLCVEITITYYAVSLSIRTSNGEILEWQFHGNSGRFHFLIGVINDYQWGKLLQQNLNYFHESGQCSWMGFMVMIGSVTSCQDEDDDCQQWPSRKLFTTSQSQRKWQMHRAYFRRAASRKIKFPPRNTHSLNVYHKNETVSHSHTRTPLFVLCQLDIRSIRRYIICLFAWFDYLCIRVVCDCYYYQPSEIGVRPSECQVNVYTAIESDRGIP